MNFTKEVFRRRLEFGLSASHSSSGQAQDPARPVEVGRADFDDILRIRGDQEFLQAAYQRILGREADPSGMVGYLEALRNHTPRRLVLRRMASSDEAKRHAGASSRALPGTGPDARSWIRRLRDRVTTAVRNLVKQLVLSRFDSIDYRLGFVLQEMASRHVALSEKVDESFGALSEKLDHSLQSSNTELVSLRRDFDVRLAALEARIEPQNAEILSLLKAQSDALQELQLRLSTLESARELESQRAEAQRDPESARREILSACGMLQRQLLHSTVRYVRVDDLLLGVPPQEWRLAAFLEHRGLPEPGLIHLLKSMVKPGMVVVDVGANLGIVTLCLARILVGSAGKIHSFEPDPGTCELLRGNIQVNGFLESGIVTVHETAVWDHETEAELTVFPDRSGHNTLFDPRTGEGQKVMVRTTSLDRALEGQDERSIDLIKIDVEGAEPFVWRGMKRVLEQNLGIQVILEFAPIHLNRAGVSPASFLDEIESAGFEIRLIDDLTGEPRRLSQRDLLLNAWSANLLLTRRAES